jgi:hypothetical protein
MYKFSFSPEWRTERDQLYVLATEGTDNAEAVELVTVYRAAAMECNTAQTAYNYRISFESENNLETAYQQYLAARRALIEFIKTKHLDFVDPDTE